VVSEVKQGKPLECIFQKNEQSSITKDMKGKVKVQASWMQGLHSAQKINNKYFTFNFACK